MGQLSRFLRSVEGGYSHWCPGCGETHVIPTGPPYRIHWGFNGNLELPTFTPSVHITYNGKDAGRDREGGPYACCHYNLTAGVLQFHSDSTHPLAGQIVQLPELPEHLRDQQA